MKYSTGGGGGAICDDLINPISYGQGIIPVFFGGVIYTKFLSSINRNC
jgi:hypothetical protein